jgi:hypothetical protein
VVELEFMLDMTGNTFLKIKQVGPLELVAKLSYFITGIFSYAR